MGPNDADRLANSVDTDQTATYVKLCTEICDTRQIFMGDLKNSVRFLQTSPK